MIIPPKESSFLQTADMKKTGTGKKRFLYTVIKHVI